MLVILTAKINRNYKCPVPDVRGEAGPKKDFGLGGRMKSGAAESNSGQMPGCSPLGPPLPDVYKEKAIETMTIMAIYMR